MVITSRPNLFKRFKKLKLFFFFLLLNNIVMAATSGTLVVKGQVSQIVSITVNPKTVSTSLPLSVSQNNKRVATIKERSNSNTGYNVKISSINQGRLVRTGGTETFSYTLKYANTLLDLSTVTVINNSSSNLVNRNRALKISYVGVPAENMVAGEYTDTILFQITAN